METIEVRYKPIGGGFYHKYIIYTDKDGNQTIIRGGPENGDGYDDRGGIDNSFPATFGRVVTEVKPYDLTDPNTPDRDFENDDPREIIKEGPDLSDDFSKMKEFAESLNEFTYQYQPVGQNSNSTVDDILERSGLPPAQLDDVYNSPGSDVPFTIFYPDNHWEKILPPWLQGVLGDFGLARVTSSPLVLDLDGDGIELSALNATGSVYWDIDQDGFAEATGWATGGDGFLAIDLNTDGVISSHTELFGNTDTYANGFLSLAAYDTNSDGLITSTDAQFNDLVVWVDANANGYGEASELQTLSALGITEIDLGYSDVNYQIAGNDILQESTFTMNGTTRDIVDAWFAYDNANTEYVGDYTLDVRTLFLPTLRGYGELPDLHIAMSQDETLLTLVQELAVANSAAILSSAFDLQGKVEAILYRWAGVEGIDPASRGTYMDARQIAFLEKLSGEVWAQGANPDPMINAASLLLKSYENAFSNITMQLLIQTEAKILLPQNAQYDPFLGEIANAEIYGYARFIDTPANPVIGSDDQDLYVYYSGDGDEIIRDSGGADVLTFDSSVTTNDVRLWNPNNGDLDVYIGLNRVRIQNHFNGTDEEIETAVFSDGTTWDLLNNLTITGISGDDVVYGLDDNNTLIGLTGADFLQGKAGDDTYIWNIGDGNDRILDTSGTDSIQFGAGITIDDVRLWNQNDGDLELHIGSEYIEIKDQFDGTNEEIESAIFADGTTLDLLNNLTITGTSANETVYGLDDDNTLIGLVGADFLQGKAGDDTYFWNLGDGNDRITDTSGTADILSFGDGINAEDVWFTDQNSNDLHAFIGPENIKINDHLAGTNEEIESALFVDGFSLNLTRYGTANWTELANTGITYNGSVDANTIIGGTGADVINGLDGDDEISGGAGTDTLYGAVGNDSLHGGSGNDTLKGWDGNDVLYGGDDDDLLQGEDGDDQLFGGAGIDTLEGGSGADTLYGEEGNDTLNGGGNNDTLFGGLGDDQLFGVSGNDEIHGGAGADTISAWNGSDTAYGDAGDDTIYGGEGNDSLHGGDDNDIINGEDGNDVLYGDAGNDILNGGAKLDILHGGHGDDTLYGVAGDDTLNGDAGDDTLDGGSGIDNLYGGDDNDILYGNSGNDYLYGGTGIDTLYGQTGHDFLRGGAGADILYGGGADNKVDRFIFEDNFSFQGVDTIKDFATGEDKIDISDILSGFYTAGVDDIADFVSISDVGTHTTISVDQDGGADNYQDIAVVENVTWLTLTDLTNNDLLF